jgi:hypothetical protein
VEVGDFARYVNTGTVGKVEDVMEEEGVSWVLLDVTELYYDKAKLEKASEDEYKPVTIREKTLDERLQDLEDLHQSMLELEDTFGDITPDGT